MIVAVFIWDPVCCTFLIVSALVNGQWSIWQRAWHKVSRVDIQGMLTQVHFSFHPALSPSERRIVGAWRSPDFKSDEGCSSINSLPLLCWWQRLLCVFSLSFSWEINFVACHWICFPKCSLEILFEINYQVNKDRYYILIWEHSIWNLFFFFKSTLVVPSFKGYGRLGEIYVSLWLWTFASPG